MAGPRACYQHIYDYHLDNVKKTIRLIAKNSNSRWWIPNQVQVNHESNSEILHIMVTRNGSWKNRKIDLEFNEDQECLWHHWKDKIKMKLERIWATEAELKRNKESWYCTTTCIALNCILVIMIVHIELVIVYNLNFIQCIKLAFNLMYNLE